MDEQFLLAINGDWDALLTALRDNRTLAHQTDDNGMTLLHWVCLHQDIPTEVLIKIVFANPHAVNIPNEAGHMPIDLAVQAECEERILEVLRAADASRQEYEAEQLEQGSSSQYSQYSPSYQGRGGPHDYSFPEEEDMTFEDPRYFTKQPAHPPHSPHRDQFGYADEQQQHPNQHSPTSGDLPLTTTYGTTRKPLYAIYSGVAHPGELQSKSLSLADGRYHSGRNLGSESVVSEEYLGNRLETQSDSHVLQSHHHHHGGKWQPTGPVSKGTAFPPRWKQSRSCHVCTCRFTLTRRRHHCRNCGFSVCSQHSTNRVPLPKFDLKDCQRVCDKCFLAGYHLLGDGHIPGAVSVVPGARSERNFDMHQQFSHGENTFGYARS